MRDWFRRDLPAFLAQNGGDGLFPDLLEQSENAGHEEDQR
ncbi:hypothetical protein ABID21_002005 [Pseudorhizobium tarimense]|uniref:Uncharacterized protein n=1 Tax=Pseudorhizobium tarimense TaxID=1079109 RepID=A0ABV2H5R7_9HYPH